MGVEPLERDGGTSRRSLLRSFVAEVVALPPGAELVAGLLSLMGRELTAREWVEVAVGWKRLVAFCTAGQLTAVAEVDRALAPLDGRRHPGRAAADELAPGAADGAAGGVPDGRVDPAAGGRPAGHPRCSRRRADRSDPGAGGRRGHP